MDKYNILNGSLISFMTNKVKMYGGINLAQGIPGFNPPKELIDILIMISSENIHQYVPGNGDNKLLNYKISTGSLKGMNNKIKVLKKKAYGCRDMQYFKLKIFNFHHAKYPLL